MTISGATNQSITNGNSLYGGIPPQISNGSTGAFHIILNKPAANSQTFNSGTISNTDWTLTSGIFNTTGDTISSAMFMNGGTWNINGCTITGAISGTTGVINMTGGTTQINTSTSSTIVPISVTAGTLGGSGIISSAITVSAGAGIIGGTGASNAGTFSTGALTLNTGALITVNIATANTVSKVAVTGNITLNANVPTFQSVALNAGTYTLFTYTGTLSGTLGTPVLTGTGRTFGSYSYTGGTVTITLT